MSNERLPNHKPSNMQRRRLLQGAACVGMASLAPVVFAADAVIENTVTSTNAGSALRSVPVPAITGKLVSKIYDPINTVVLKNNSNTTIVIKQLSKGAFMFDGNIIDCNTACLSKPITIPANKDVLVQFDKRKQSLVKHHPTEFRHIQHRIERLSDGTRVVPFTATLVEGTATVV